MIVQGILEGSVESERLEIMADGRVLGSILSTELIIQAKGHFEGDSKIKHADKKNKAVNTAINEKKKEA